MTVSAEPRNPAVYFPPAGSVGAPIRTWRPLPITLEAANMRDLHAAAAEPTIEGIARNAADTLNITGDTILIGYSLGGLIAHEVARALHDRGAQGPGGLVLLGCRPPHLSTTSLVVDLDGGHDLDVVRRLIDRGALDPALIEHRAVRFMLPPLRRDISLVRGYEPDATRMQGDPLDVPILCVAGASDVVARPADTEQWVHYTRADFEHLVLDGDHQFPVTEGAAIASLLARFVVGRSRQGDVSTAPTGG